MAKDDRIAFRTSEDLKARFAASARKVKLSESQLGEACIEALVDYVETNGNVTYPLATIPLNVLQRIVGAPDNAEAKEIYERLRQLMLGALPSFGVAGESINVAGAGGSSTSSTRAPLAAPLTHPRTAPENPTVPLSPTRGGIETNQQREKKKVSK